MGSCPVKGQCSSGTIPSKLVIVACLGGVVGTLVVQGQRFGIAALRCFQGLGENSVKKPLALFRNRQEHGIAHTIVERLDLIGLAWSGAADEVREAQRIQRCGITAAETSSDIGVGLGKRLTMHGDDLKQVTAVVFKRCNPIAQQVIDAQAVSREGMRLLGREAAGVARQLDCEVGVATGLFRNARRHFSSICSFAEKGTREVLCLLM